MITRQDRSGWVRMFLGLVLVTAFVLPLSQAGEARLAQAAVCDPVVAPAGGPERSAAARAALRGEVVFGLDDRASIRSVGVRICSAGEPRPTYVELTDLTAEGDHWRAADPRIAAVLARPGPHVVSLTVTDAAGRTSKASNALTLP